MDSPPAIYRLPEDTLRQIFAALPLRQIAVSRAVSKHLNQLLTSPCFVDMIAGRSTLRLIALRPDRHVSSSGAALQAFDPEAARWLSLPLDFLPFRSLVPAAAAPPGVLYLWADSAALVACNPLTRRFRVLPRLGSAWARHGSVLADSAGRVMVLSELAALLFSGPPRWAPAPSDLPSKPRSPVVVSGRAYALCDVGSPWRSQWKLFSRAVSPSEGSWCGVERHEWGDVFDILRRPRLVAGRGGAGLLMVGGLWSSFSLNSSCSAVLVLRLRLDSLEWDEAARMPPEMFRCFHESAKFKVFGGGGRVCFSAKRVPRLALWEEDDEADQSRPATWCWIDAAPSSSSSAAAPGLCRGLVFEASLSPVL